VWWLSLLSFERGGCLYAADLALVICERLKGGFSAFFLFCLDFDSEGESLFWLSSFGQVQYNKKKELMPLNSSAKNN
jgi:hypothetical protein